MRNYLGRVFHNFLTEILAVWGITSVIFISMAFLPFVLLDSTVLQMSSFLRVSEFHGDCLLCGMTRAYIAISNLDLVSAIELNALSLPLWSFSVINFEFMIKHCIHRLLPFQRSLLWLWGGSPFKVTFQCFV